MKVFFLVSFVFAAFTFSLAQGRDSSISINKDSVRIFPGDTLKADSLKFIRKDTSSVSDSAKKKSIGVDTVIYTSSRDSLFFHVNKKKMIFTETAS